MKYLLIKGETLVENDTNCFVMNYCRGEDGNKYVFKIPFVPYFYSPEIKNVDGIVRIEKEAKLDLFGKSVHKIIVKTPNHVKGIRNNFKIHHEADIPFVMRYRYDTGIKGCFEFEDDIKFANPISNPGISPKCICEDIETLDDVDSKNASSPVVSIAIKDESKNKFLCLINTSKEINIELIQSIIDTHLASYKNYKPIEFKVMKYPSEALMLIARQKFIDQVVMPDVIYGWNYTAFDKEYLENRANNVTDFTPYMAFDLMHAYKTLTENELVSDKLEDVAHAELKVGKLPRTTIKYLLENDIDSLIAYNIIDVYLTSEINRKSDIIKFHQTLAEIAGTDLEGTKYNSNIVDSVLIHFVGGRIALPSKGMLTTTGIEEGGRVHEAFTGIKRWVAVMDLSRAYPTTIQVNNLSPETKLGHQCMNCHKSDRCDIKDKYTNKKCPSIATIQDSFIMPSGRCYLKNPIGLIPAVFKLLISQRKEYQTSMKEAIKNGDKETEKKFYEMQRAVKYTMNTFYGVLGSIDEETGKGKFRLADGEIGSDVTESIRLLNKWIEHHIEDLDVLSKYVDHDGPESELFNIALEYKEYFKPIYGDTDSVVFTIAEPEKISKDKIINMLMLISKLLNRSFVDFGLELSGVETNLYEVEFEKLYESFFQGGKKKRYAGLYAWKKGAWLTDRSFDERKDIKGYEIRRSDSSKFTKQCQEKVFEMVLTTMDKKEISFALQQWKQEFYDGTHNVNIKIPKGISKTEYTKSLPIQMRAAGYSNKYLGKSFKAPTKIFYVYMKSMTFKGAPDTDVIGLEIDDDPSDFGIIDYDLMFEKVFVNPINRITESIWPDSWNELITGMVQNTLEEFW